MKLGAWLTGLFGRRENMTLSDMCDEVAAAATGVCIREMAFWSAVNLVANAVSKCEFKTFRGDQEWRGKTYYSWNISPNKNQNSSAFIHKLISTLYRDNECLIIPEEYGQQLLVADSFVRTPYTKFGDQFSEVMVGSITYHRVFTQDDVMHFKLSEGNMRKILNCVYADYAKLISYTMNAYQKSRGTKGIFSYQTIPPGDTEERKAFDDLVNNKIKAWMQGDNAALPLFKGQSWVELQHKTYTNESTRDIRAMINDIMDFTATAFGIPPALLRGDVQDTTTAINQLLTFTIDPLVDMLSEEINRKTYGQAGFLAGDRILIDTRSVNHVDLLSSATSVDKLIASGAFSINEIRKLVGEQTINKPWADGHYLTRNYTPLGEGEMIMTASDITQP